MNSYNSSTDYLEFPATINPYTIWNGKGITFSCWVRFTAHELWSRLFEFQPAASTESGIRFSIKSAPGVGNRAINIRVGSTEFNYSDWNNPLITNLNVWRHLVFCIGISGNWDIYIDNVRINGTETASIPNITYNIRYINRSAYSGDGSFDAQMDELRIYDRALSAADVS
ncbi:MAG: LamG domain-containing protein, partial [Actinobacteria bacterium]|nr:LamG domain-containing protein [Actinomycetota bacterium]